MEKLNSYRKKIIISGEFVEVYEYEKNQVIGQKKDVVSTTKREELKSERKRREDNLIVPEIISSV